MCGPLHYYNHTSNVYGESSLAQELIKQTLVQTSLSKIEPEKTAM